MKKKNKTCNTKKSVENDKCTDRYFLVQPQRKKGSGGPNSLPQVNLVKWGMQDCGCCLPSSPPKSPITDYQGCFPLQFKQDSTFKLHFVLYVNNHKDKNKPLLSFNVHTPILVDMNQAPVVFNTHLHSIEKWGKKYQAVTLHIGWVGPILPSGSSSPIYPLNIQFVCADFRELPYHELRANNYYSQDPQIGVQGPIKPD